MYVYAYDENRMSQPPLSTKRSRGASPGGRGTRVRRGNEQDQQALRRAVLDAALALFKESGLAGVTMRGVAARVGVSAMALYHYFPSKDALLYGLWEATIDELQAELTQAMALAGPQARARLRAWVDAFFSYYEAHPENYRLVFMMDTHESESSSPPWAELPAYLQVLQAGTSLSRDVARELGGDGHESRLRQAGELRLSMSVGYLHSRLINTRYPWSDLPALRATMVNMIVQAVEACLAGACPGQAADQAE